MKKRKNASDPFVSISRSFMDFSRSHLLSDVRQKTHLLLRFKNAVADLSLEFDDYHQKVCKCGFMVFVSPLTEMGCPLYLNLSVCLCVCVYLQDAHEILNSVRAPDCDQMVLFCDQNLRQRH